jgi:hypothetical protein
MPMKPKKKKKKNARITNSSCWTTSQNWNSNSLKNTTQHWTIRLSTIEFLSKLLSTAIIWSKYREWLSKYLLFLCLSLKIFRYSSNAFMDPLPAYNYLSFENELADLKWILQFCSAIRHLVSQLLILR